MPSGLPKRLIDMALNKTLLVAALLCAVAAGAGEARPAAAAFGGKSPLGGLAGRLPAPPPILADWSRP